MLRQHCCTFQQLCNGKRGYACDFTVNIPFGPEAAKNRLIGHINRCIQDLQAGQREIATFHIERTYIPTNRGTHHPGNPGRLNMKGIGHHWRTRTYEKDGLVVLTVFSEDNLPARWHASLESYASLLVAQLREHFEEVDFRLEDQDLTAGVRCAKEHPRFAIFMAFTFWPHTL